MKNGFILVFVALTLITVAISQEPARSDKAGTIPSGKQTLRVRVSRPFAESLMIRKVAPEYPRKALEQRIEGDVAVSVLVDIQGIVRQATYISGNPLLKDAAIDAAKNYRFHSYVVNGEPVELETQVLIKFRLAPNTGPS